MPTSGGVILWIAELGFKSTMARFFLFSRVPGNGFGLFYRYIYSFQSLTMTAMASRLLFIRGSCTCRGSER